MKILEMKNTKTQNSKDSLNSRTEDMGWLSKLEEREFPNYGQAWWFTPIILGIWESEVGRSLETRSLKPAWPT